MIFDILNTEKGNVNINYSDILFINVYAEIKHMRFYIKNDTDLMFDIGCNYIDYDILKHFTPIDNVSISCKYINLNSIKSVRIENTYIVISHRKLPYGISYHDTDNTYFLRAVKLKNIENFLTDNQTIIEIIE